MLFPTIINRKNIATQLFYLENFTIKLRKKRLKFMSVCFKKIDRCINFVHRCWIYLSKKWKFTFPFSQQDASMLSRPILGFSGEILNPSNYRH